MYELGEDEKVVQRILRRAESHMAKDRYIKAFDLAVLAAMTSTLSFGCFTVDTMTWCANSAPARQA
jgi:hypothetical protein